tara:strand:+ start:14230 stop:15204 length:975 start_codon:yes stop_codon:yes gene_type:complete
MEWEKLSAMVSNVTKEYLKPNDGQSVLNVMELLAQRLCPWTARGLAFLIEYQLSIESHLSSPLQERTGQYNEYSRGRILKCRRKERLNCLISGMFKGLTDVDGCKNALFSSNKEVADVHRAWLTDIKWGKINLNPYIQQQLSIALTTLLKDPQWGSHSAELLCCAYDLTSWDIVKELKGNRALYKTYKDMDQGQFVEHLQLKLRANISEYQSSNRIYDDGWSLEEYSLDNDDKAAFQSAKCARGDSLPTALWEPIPTAPNDETPHEEKQGSTAPSDDEPPREEKQGSTAPSDDELPREENQTTFKRRRTCWNLTTRCFKEERQE